MLTMATSAGQIRTQHLDETEKGHETVGHCFIEVSVRQGSVLIFIFLYFSVKEINNILLLQYYCATITIGSFGWHDFTRPTEK